MGLYPCIIPNNQWMLLPEVYHVQDEDDHAKSIPDLARLEADRIAIWLCALKIDSGKLVFEELFFNNV